MGETWWTAGMVYDGQRCLGCSGWVPVLSHHCHYNCEGEQADDHRERYADQLDEPPYQSAGREVVRFRAEGCGVRGAEGEQEHHDRGSTAVEMWTQSAKPKRRGVVGGPGEAYPEELLK